MFCDVKFSARSQIRRDYFHPTIFLHGDIFFCGPPLGVEKAAKICYNVFPRSNICSVMWNLVLARRPARLFSPDHFFARGHFFFVGHPYELCLTNIFDLCLGTFASLTLPSKTASLWLFCLCSLANSARLFSTDHILARGHYFFVCDPNTGTFENCS